MKQSILAFFFISTCFLAGFGQKQATSIIGFYNCENLFDTINDPIKKDEEYLPTSAKHWNTTKYNEKLAHLARVIMAVGDWKGPDVIGLCEVENRQVVEDLVSKTYLNQHGYQIVHEESKDKRGIDVAMLYKPSSFDLINYEYISVTSPSSSRPTRDVLYAKGVLKGIDTVHLFYNHWPSRFGGVMATMAKREYAAQVLRTKVDSIFTENEEAIVLISGDFNDHVDNESITKYLAAHGTLSDSLQKPYLYNTSYRLKKELKQGTHKFNGHWSIFDQWIVSSAVLDKKNSFYLPQENSIIYKKPWLLHEDEQSFGVKPFRSFAGSAYLGGYSDHLPVIIKLLSE